MHINVEVNSPVPAVIVISVTAPVKDITKILFCDKFPRSNSGAYYYDSILRGYVVTHSS